jgi:hypothetical protein
MIIVAHHVYLRYLRDKRTTLSYSPGIAHAAKSPRAGTSRRERETQGACPMSESEYKPVTGQPTVNPAPLPHPERIALLIVARLALAELLPADTLHGPGNSIDGLVAVIAGAISESLLFMGEGWLADQAP